MPSLCLACELVFASPFDLNKHKCGELAARYTVPDVGSRVSTAQEVMPHRICPACARLYLDRKGAPNANNTTPAHNIVSRDALKTDDTTKRAFLQHRIGASSIAQAGLETYANMLMVYFILHFDGLISKSTLPGYRVWTDDNNKALEGWDFVTSFIAARPDYLFRDSPARPKFPYAVGDGDRDDTEFSYQGLLDILFGTLATSKSRDKAVDVADWDASASAVDKVSAILKAVKGIAPSDSYADTYCQTQDGAQCDTCEKRQGEANLLTRYHAAKKFIGQTCKRLDGGSERWDARSLGLLSFVGLQFCCNDGGYRVSSIEDISEEWLTKAVFWQLARHLGKLGDDLAAKKATSPLVELLHKNFQAFSQFYVLSFLRLSAGDYATGNGAFEKGSLSDGVKAWLKKVDEKGANTTVRVNVSQRRFVLETGSLVGGKACLLEPAY